MQNNQFRKMMYIAPIWTKIDMLYNIHYLYLKLLNTKNNPKVRFLGQWLVKSD